MIRFTSDIQYDGPLFSANERDYAIANAEFQIEDDLQDAALKKVGEIGQGRFRYVDKSNHHVPGKWLHSLKKTHVDGDPAVTTDIIYGFWLEGVGSRNFPRTRFRGYRMWREATQVLQSEAVDIAQPAIDKAVARLNA